MKPNKPLRSTRLFSLQLADHDGLFAPRRERSYNPMAWIRATAIAIPALIALAFPSFRIGQAIWLDPGVALPEVLKQGELFTVPTPEAGNFVPAVAGHPLAYVDGKKPLYVGAALKPFDFDVSFEFSRDDDQKEKLKALLPRPKHPKYPIFVKHVRVMADEPPAAAGEEARQDRLDKGKLKAKAPTPPPEIDEKEAKIYERRDGYARLRCWKEPSVEPLGVDPLKPRRNPKLGSINAAGPGEVAYSSPTGGGENVVVIYHGGGLFSRYWGIRENRLPKNGRVSIGQTVGYVHLASIGKDTPVNWQVLMGAQGGPAEIKTTALLELSSQLCDSK